MFWWTLIGTALGQGYLGEPPPYAELDTQLYRMPIDVTRTMWTEDAKAAPRDYVSGRLVLGYLNGPARFVGDEGDEFLVKDAMSIDTLIGIADKRFRFALDLPLWIRATSDLHAQTSGVGDLSFDAKGTILDPGDAGLGLALSSRLTFPTSVVEASLASKGALVDVNGIADWRDERLLVALNFGFRAGAPTQVGDLELDDFLLFKVGAGYAIWPEAGVSLDVAGQYGLEGGGIAALPVEAMIGGWGRVSESFVLRGGFGIGLTGGVGAPAARLVFSTTFEPPRAKDSDGDGIIDREEQCLDEPEDHDGFQDLDGCPDLDNDGDGLSDVFDPCPLEPEDRDGWQDDDGCPDPDTHVTVRVVDTQGRLILGVQSKVVGMGAEHIGSADLEVDLEPGEYTFSASGEGYAPYTLTAAIPPGMPLTATLPVTPKESTTTGLATIVLRDQFGKPVQGTWAWDGAPSLPIRDGEAAVAGPPGAHQVHVTAKAHFPTDVAVVIPEDGSVQLSPELKPGVGKIRLTVVDSTGRAVDASWAYDDVETFETRKGVAAAKLPAGDYTLTVSAEGYAPWSRPLTLEVGADLEISAVLYPVPE